MYQTGHNMPFNDVCPQQGEGMKLMILVTSATSHVSRRNTVRSTWGNVAFRQDIGLAFMLGISKNSSINEQIERENLFFGDIIQVKIMKFITFFNTCIIYISVKRVCSSIRITT